MYPDWVNIGNMMAERRRVIARSPAHFPQLGSGLAFLLVDAFSVFFDRQTQPLIVTRQHQTTLDAPT